MMALPAGPSPTRTYGLGEQTNIWGFDPFQDAEVYSFCAITIFPKYEQLVSVGDIIDQLQAELENPRACEKHLHRLRCRIRLETQPEEPRRSAPIIVARRPHRAICPVQRRTAKGVRNWRRSSK